MVLISDLVNDEKYVQRQISET